MALPSPYASQLEARPEQASRAARYLFVVVAVAALAGTAVLFFRGFQRSPDILRDEITYWIISQNVATHASVSLYESPFVLHPPLLFLVEGAALRLTGGPNDFLYGTLAIRWLCVVSGLVTAGLILAVSTRTAGKAAGLVAVAIFSCDPLVLRTVRRDLLEAPTMLLVMVALLLLSWGRPRGLTRPALAGLVIGAALLVKEYAGFMLGVLIAQWVWSRLCRRWGKEPQGELTTTQAAAALVAAVAVYTLYPLGWWIAGDGPLFLHEKGYLLARFLGLIHDTGLARKDTHITFLTILKLNMEQYASSYVLLAAGGLTGVWLLLTAKRYGTAVLGLWSVVVMSWTAFETVHGLAEEEFYYYAVIPASITTAALLVEIASRLWRKEAGDRRTRWTAWLPAALSIAALAALLGYNGTVWARVYASPDDAVATMRQYLDHHLPPRTVIIAGNEMDGPSFANDTFRLIRRPGTNVRALKQYRILQPADVRTLARSGARYVILSTKDVYLGYGVMGRAAAAYVHAHGTVVFSAYSTTYWDIQLIRLHPDVAPSPRAPVSRHRRDGARQRVALSAVQRSAGRYRPAAERVHRGTRNHHRAGRSRHRLHHSRHVRRRHVSHRRNRHA